MTAGHLYGYGSSPRSGSLDGRWVVHDCRAKVETDRLYFRPRQLEFPLRSDQRHTQRQLEFTPGRTLP